MCGRRFLLVGAATFVVLTSRAQALGGGLHGAAWHGWHGETGHHLSHGIPGPMSAGVGGFGFYGGFAPVVAIGPGAFMPPVGWMSPAFMPGPGPLLPPPPPGMLWPNGRPNANRTNLKPGDPGRSGQLTTFGDRLFRAGNFRKAEDRYLQATRAAPGLAAPRVRLAQVALVRGRYADAADRFREAETAQPGWIVTAPDIQAMYGEPTEFAHYVARLESHLQTHPDDRDAWLVLGAQWFLSGRTTRAADVFKRLDDPNRKSDVALAAFLDASNQADQRPAGIIPPKPDDALK
jgi:Tetratricopeptide repeat